MRYVERDEAHPKSDSAARPEPLHEADSIAVASPGRIEGRSDSIDVGAAIDGVIQAIHVREGQQVKRGQVLAELDCRDLKSVLPVARAEAESLQHTRERLLRGSRKEEREAAAQRTLAAKAEYTQASAQLQRSRTLAESQLISRVVFDQARRDADVAEAEYKRAMRNEELVNAEPLVEEVARADSDLRAAKERIKLADEKLAKCLVRAPIDGAVLRVHLRQGESFSLVSPRPLLTMADISGRRVRAELDERDVDKVHIGSPVMVYSEAYSGRRFAGKVTRVASLMGKKSVLTGDPVDKSDRDILEVMAQLDPAARVLPLGLRVTVQFAH
jgi:ABC exporter DevB family membrane fusion protein